MDGLLIFDSSNDLIYKNINDDLMQKIRDAAIQQNLIDDDDEEHSILDNNIILQVFCPLINSQKMMFCHFDNSYTSFQCGGNLNLLFGEFLGYIILKIGTQPYEYLRRSIQVSICFASHICGTNLIELKQKENKSILYTDLIETWSNLYQEEQSMLLEGIDQLFVNIDLRNVINTTLTDAAIKLQQDPHSQRCHAILFVAQKLAGLYSSRQAQKLAPSDLLFLSILSKTLQSKVCTKAINIHSHLIFLQGQLTYGVYGTIPHIVHTCILDKGVALNLLIEYGNLNVSSCFYDTFFGLIKANYIQMQGDLDAMKPAFSVLEIYIKQMIENMKKAKYNSIEIDTSFKKFLLKWEILKKKYNDYYKNLEKTSVVQIDSNIPVVLEQLKELFKVTFLDCDVIEQGFERVSEISTLVEERLLEFSEFLSVKAQRNLTIASYLEEFPGLVHFIYLDRSSGTIIAPDISTETNLIPKEKVWSLVELSRAYLSKGQTSVMWKDTAFNYSYFLWFEDHHGTSLKPKTLENQIQQFHTNKPQHEPGVLCGDYYKLLCEELFPKMTPSKMKCCELFCVHLGLVTATCALEHSRRLVATIGDVTGSPAFEVL